MPSWMRAKVHLVHHKTLAGAQQMLLGNHMAGVTVGNPTPLLSLQAPKL